jgi:hypothetical protein
MSSAHIHANEVQKTAEPVRQPGREPIRRQEQEPVQAVAPQVAYRRVQLSRNGPRPADLLALQRAVGNRAVQRMLAEHVDKANDEQQDEAAEEDSERTVQTKLSTGTPNDVYEQENDRVIGQVMTPPDAATQRPNRTGLPDGLKAGVESLSGISLDSVNVHYNSSQPAQLNALAYTQGSDIHVAPGQEGHLPHEAWHVVQQAQGRVQPTMQMKDGVRVNDDQGLEQEADVMGRRAEQMTGHEGEQNARPDPINVKSQPVQKKPRDIKSKWQLNIQNNAIANQGAQRRGRSVAWPRNKLIVGGNDPYTGGHLFKAEYGGPDNITNVVPWDNGAEDKYSNFEAAYRRAALAKAKQGDGNATSEISVTASFKEEKDVNANTIKGYRDHQQHNIRKPDIAKIVNQTLSLTPTKVESKDDNGNEIKLTQNDLGHTSIPPKEQLTTLLSLTDADLMAVKHEADSVEKGD